MKVLLAVDGSDYTQRMLTYLAAHPALLAEGVEFTALTVSWPVSSTPSAHLPVQTLQKHFDAEAEETLKPVVEIAAQNGWKLSTLARVGNPGKTIAEVADSEGYDLIVMGSHGHSAIVNTVIGSIVTRVLALAKTPVLIIR